MASEDLSERDRFAYEELSFESFRQTSQTREFDCGNDALNDFLITEEVESYAKHRLGNTTLVFASGQLVAYYTVGMSSLKFQYLKRVKQIGWPNELEVEAIPAMLLGRFAVRKDLRNKGLGRLLLNHLIALAIEQEIPARLILLNAEEGSVGFYTRCGFHMAAKRGNEARQQPIMFYDLGAVPPLD